ncbi:hypothetical protein BTR14_16940 [Rhizobium rhizosphaerae]|uniref:Uncharacterized protein n=1 Tax=Xaviernesmea rhizosphaerae TaxID=1672749 RepID=A0ABX3P9N5_9HYPH|nr:EAL domain-containing protein [Xaviernesmea rhizosphaerae]OQP85049.1 hypothetical protein BTR14_16940 [Xaviernesmea rhizosphaerae]
MITRASSELPGRFKRLRVVLVTITAALAVSAVLCSLLAVQYQERIMTASRYNDAFDLSQTAVELLRLQSAVQDFVISGDGKAIALRLDIFRSRVTTIEAREDLKDAERVAFLDGLRGLLAEIGDEFARDPRPEAALTILRLMSPLVPPSVRMAARAHSTGGDVVQDNQTHLKYIFASLCSVIVALVLFGAVLVTFVLNQNRLLDHFARLDGLTGLLNRLGFNEKVSQVKDEMIAVILVDVDHFKELNDTMGHEAGDMVLAELAVRLKASAPDATAIARLGGDEFALLYAGADAQARSCATAERILASLKESMVVDGRDVMIGATLGLCMGNDALTRAVMLNNADIALYRAKADGRGHFRVFTPSMRDELLRRKKLMNALRLAIVHDELFLLFQPIVDTTTGKTRGFEALLRWRHPELGTIPPSEFIDLAELSGQIVAIGAWVIDQACREAASWPSDLFISFNVSARQLTDNALIACVAKAAATHGIACERMVVEITESTLIDNDAAALSVLHELQAMGCSIALDDFGTGYASLSYLQRFPFDKLKIDQSFLRKLDGENCDDAKIVRAIGELGRQMALTIVSEGVETPEQLALVRSARCALAQGYLFDRPLSPKAARDRLRQEGATVLGIAFERPATATGPGSRA